MRSKALTVLMIVLTACGTGSSNGAGGSTGDVTGETAPTGVTSATGGEVSSPVEGTWRMEGITEDLLRDAGIKPHEIAVVLGSNGAEEELASTVRLRDGSWQGFLAADGGEEVPAQSGTYTVEGHMIVMIDSLSPDIRYEYRWSIDHQDRLHLEVLSIENAPPSEGVDDSVFQYAFYESQPLERIG